MHPTNLLWNYNQLWRYPKQPGNEWVNKKTNMYDNHNILKVKKYGMDKIVFQRNVNL